MEDFQFTSHLYPIYNRFPEGQQKPIIGITTNYNDGDATLRAVYYKQVVAAGGTPMLIPPVADADVLATTLSHIDALLLTGGADYNPLWCGEEPSQHLGHVNAERDLPEMLLTRMAYDRQIPMLGTCRGIQTLAMALDGRVAQDISALPHSIQHDQNADKHEPTHSIMVEPMSYLHDIYGKDKLFVNSFHHQAVSEPGPRFRVTAKAPDGTIEAIESNEYKAILGVQWHPEWMGTDGRPLFSWLVDRAREFRDAKALHSRILTLDSHCDTPMFFPQGIRFDQRDPHILVDLHKMTDGHQDAVTMAAYLPQPKPGQTFKEIAPYPVDTPTEYADLIFDKIEDIAAHNSQYLSIARTPQDLYEDKRHGRKSIMLAIENGLALGHDLQNVRHFAQRGVVYITLCHNGDNAICDSCKRSDNTHNGVSPFGEEVIHEMNREGIMVDLSHAGEKSFYDALDISSKPIVLSHACCRALCNVPRNVSDDQMRQLARKGGVMQVTLYHGFLRSDAEATINDAIDHLEHAISVMGIDHVGLGTDFDGDGGVRGLADSSAMLQFTIRLLRKRYSESDIEKIWGGNWLRVMAKVKEKD